MMRGSNSGTMPLNTYPVILTETDWNNNKGVIAKMAGETGIGAALKAVKDEWDKVDWNKVDPLIARNHVTEKFTLATVDKMMVVAKGEYPKLENVQRKLTALSKLALAASVKFKASKVIAKSSADHVTRIWATSESINKTLVTNVDAAWREFRKVQSDKDLLRLQTALKSIDGYFVSLKKFAIEIQNTPTVAQYRGGATSGFHQNVRGLNAALANATNPVWIKWAEDNWNDFALDSYVPKEESDKGKEAIAVKAKVAEVLAALKKCEAIVH